MSAQCKERKLVILFQRCRKSGTWCNYVVFFYVLEKGIFYSFFIMILLIYSILVCMQLYGL